MDDLDMDAMPPSTRSTFGRTVISSELPSQSVAFNELQETLAAWETDNMLPSFEPIQTLDKLSSLLESAHEQFLQQDPDPLDDRHPHHTHPYSVYGLLLKNLLRDKDFMARLANSYLLARDNIPLNVSAARLLLNTIPAIDALAVFSDPEELVPQLYRWALGSSSSLLQAYSVGLLAAAMEVPEMTSKFKPSNLQLIPVALQRLKQLKDEMERSKRSEESTANAEGGSSSNSSDACPPTTFENLEKSEASGANGPLSSRPPSSQAQSSSRQGSGLAEEEQPSILDIRVRKRPSAVAAESAPVKKKRRTTTRVSLSPVPDRGGSQSPTASNSQWRAIHSTLIGTHKIYPLTNVMHQRFILQYLAPLGEYQDLVSLAYEGNSLGLIFNYVGLDFSEDIRLTFDALKYLASLMVHRKVALEFIAKGGVGALLKVPRSSLASVGVGTCIYYMAYSSDVMEKVCQLQDQQLDELVDYALWLMEHSHESGMTAAAMFFTHSLSFRAILDRFDQRNGLRHVYNYISTLTLLQETPMDIELTDEQMQTSLQTVKNACACLRSYAFAHVNVRISQLCRPFLTSSSKSNAQSKLLSYFQQPILPYKLMQIDEEGMRLALSTLTASARSPSFSWRAIEELHRLGLTRIVYSIVHKSDDWLSSGRTETMKNALDVLWVAAVIPRVQRDLCEPPPEPPAEDEEEASDKFVPLPIQHLVFISGRPFLEKSVQIAAVNVILSCVGSGIDVEKKPRLSMPDSARKSRSGLRAEASQEIFEKMVQSIRKYNGIKILLGNLRSCKLQPESDQYRALICRLLCSLARHPEVRQLLSRLPLITSNELTDMMKKPIMEEKKAEHAKFCSEAKNLIAIVTEKSLKDVKRDLTQEKLWKSHVVSSTKISFSERELLHLIHSHLANKGFSSAASALAQEAALHNPPSPPALPGQTQPLQAAVTLKSIAPLPSRGIISADYGKRNGRVSREGTAALMASDVGRFLSPNGAKMRRGTNDFTRRLNLKQSGTPRKNPASLAAAGKPSSVGLGDIITEYFRVQHANCANPVSTCPPFSLYHPHRCPEPRFTRLIPTNITSRWLRTSLLPSKSMTTVLRENERFAFSRIRPGRTFTEHEEVYTTCSFSIDDEHLIVGMYSGEIHWLNVESGQEDAMMQCHHSAISAITPSKDGSMLLTSAFFMNPLSTLWRLGETHEHMMDFPDEKFVAFNNGTQDAVVGTNTLTATLFDIESGRSTCVMKIPRPGYKHSAASFSPDDRLILHDTCLFDPRLANPLVHEFDRFNFDNGGVFHPHGNEVIINSEVWDVRTFGLLHSVPALDQCQLHFTSTGNVMMAAQRVESRDPFELQFSSCLRTFSSIDYSVIATTDFRKTIRNVCLDHSDSSLAVVEVSRHFTPSGTSMFNRSDETICRIHEFGRVRAPDDEGEEGEEDGDEDGGGGDDNSSDSDSNSSDSQSDDSDDRDSRQELMDILDEMADGGDGSDEDYEEEEEEEEEEREEGGEANEGGEGEEGGEEGEVEGEEEEERSASEQMSDFDGEGDDDDEDDDDDSDVEIFMDDGSGGEDDMDETYDPELEPRQGSSSIVLNPNLRKRRGQGPPPPP